MHGVRTCKEQNCHPSPMLAHVRICGASWLWVDHMDCGRIACMFLISAALSRLPLPHPGYKCVMLGVVASTCYDASPHEPYMSSRTVHIPQTLILPRPKRISIDLLLCFFTGTLRGHAPAPFHLPPPFSVGASFCRSLYGTAYLYYRLVCIYTPRSLYRCRFLQGVSILWSWSYAYSCHSLQ